MRIVAVLRDREFHSLQELNAAVREEVDRINASPMPSYDRKCRREIFDEVDRPAARSLPEHSWEHQQWLRRRVGIDYCVERHVVYVAAKPPRTFLRTIAGRLGKKIVYIPLGQLSPVSLKRIRVFHVLSGHRLRQIAKDYIW